MIGTRFVTRRAALSLLGIALLAGKGLAQCPGLVPVFTWNSDNATIRFVDGTDDLGLGIDSIRWDFGDGTPLGDASPTWHTYASGGVDTVSMTLWSEGCAFNVQAPVAHGNGDDVCMLFVEPSFTTWQPSNNVVEFTNTSFTGGIPFVGAWSFGDDVLSLDETPTHIYPVPGPYSAVLNLAGTDTATGGGCTAGMARLLQVDGNGSTCDTSLFVDFTYVFDGVFAQMNADITPLDPDLIVQEYSWSFGDLSASIANQEEPDHFYIYPGEYQVCLFVAAADTTGALDPCSAVVCRTLVSNMLGVAEEAENAPLRLYPNPFLDRTIIRDGRLVGEVHFFVMDLAGQILDEERVFCDGELRIDLPQLPSGEYLLRVVDLRHSLWGRMVKQ